MSSHVRALDVSRALHARQIDLKRDGISSVSVWDQTIFANETNHQLLSHSPHWALKMLEFFSTFLH